MPMLMARIAVLITVLSFTGEFTYRHGGIIRGDRANRSIALVFTGDEFGEGAGPIRRVLDSLEVKGSFFLTGRFYRTPLFANEVRRLRADGHYLGAHSDQHLLYCSWENRDSLLVSRQEFEKDVEDNYLEMNRLGIETEDAVFFMPAYEWYNEKISLWAKEMGLQLVNYTPGTRSHADYTTPDMGERYVSSEAIMQSIFSFEATHPDGLNGFILLSHIGTAPERTDKFYLLLRPIIEKLKIDGYVFVRIDELLQQ